MPATGRTARRSDAVVILTEFMVESREGVRTVNPWKESHRVLQQETVTGFVKSEMAFCNDDQRRVDCLTGPWASCRVREEEAPALKMWRIDRTMCQTILTVPLRRGKPHRARTSSSVRVAWSAKLGVGVTDIGETVSRFRHTDTPPSLITHALENCVVWPKRFSRVRN